VVGGQLLRVGVGEEQQLGVGVDGDEGLYVAVRLDKVHDRLDLSLRVGAGSAVHLGTGLATGTSTWVTIRARRREMQSNRGLQLVIMVQVGTIMIILNYVLIL